jgi:hypothetical protein
MFDFWKPKRNAAAAGATFASPMPKLLTTFDNEEVNKQISEMVSNGACRDRIRAELTAFYCFLNWEGMTIALHRKKIGPYEYDRMVNAYFDTLNRLALTLAAESSGSLSYSTFGEWLKARIDQYITASRIGTPQQGRSRVIDNFCDFACDGEGTTRLKFHLLQIHYLYSGQIYDLLVGSRWE